ncbi:hypothetical protein PMAYCL1PPCAC_11339, partial [Pristionchus mayeri]
FVNGAAFVDGKCYFATAGGFSDVYDTISNEFIDVPPGLELTRADSTASLAVYGAKILAIGGRLPHHNVPLDTVLQYDTAHANPEWTLLTTMSTGRNSPGSCIYNDQLYVFGGDTEDGEEHSCEVYDFVTDCWRLIAPMPGSGWVCEAVAYPGRIIVVGLEDDDWNDGLRLEA